MSDNDDYDMDDNDDYGLVSFWFQTCFLLDKYDWFSYNIYQDFFIKVRLFYEPQNKKNF